MAAPTTTGGTAVTTIPKMTPSQLKEWQTHIGRVVGSNENTRLLTRLFCVGIAANMNWNADQIGEFLGGLPTQEGINRYIASYVNGGIGELERELPGDANFYKGAGGR
jgi:hypothetical protein